jgi:anti-sigma regulatory factor (Ser/Thr protein kinase)
MAFSPPKAKSETPGTPSRSTAIREFVGSHKSGIGRMVAGAFEIQTLEEAEKLSSMLAMHCPRPEHVATGVWELLSNAVEHGNLEIGFDEKADLVARQAFAGEIRRRLSLPQYAGRVVLVEFKRSPSAIHVTVTDQGRGFDVAKFFDADDGSRLPNGRGILIARVSFDRLTYLGSGNKVEALITL